MGGWRSVRLAGWLFAGCLVAVLLGGCGERERVPVSEVKRTFAQAALAAGGGSFGGEGSLGTISAESAEEGWSRLLGVEVRMGDAFWLRAESADLIVDADADTMRLRFNGVLWVAPEAEDGGPSTLEVWAGRELAVEGGEGSAGGEGVGPMSGGDGLIRSSPVRTTDPWPLGVDVVRDGGSAVRVERDAAGGDGARPAGPVRLDGD